MGTKGTKRAKTRSSEAQTVKDRGERKRPAGRLSRPRRGWWAVGHGGGRVCWPLAWTERRGRRCSHRWLATEGEAPGQGCGQRRGVRTFNVLVGAQPVPSIECSRSKLKHTDRQAVSKEQHRAREGQGCQRRRQMLPACALSPGAVPSCPSRPHPAAEAFPVSEAGQAPSPSSRVLSLHGTHGPFTPMDTKFEAGQRHAPHGAPKSMCQPSGKS